MTPLSSPLYPPLTMLKHSLLNGHAQVREILAKAKEKAFVTEHAPVNAESKSEFVQGLTLEECATLINVDSNNVELVGGAKGVSAPLLLSRGASRVKVGLHTL